MNICHNPNTPEFKALMQVYNNEDLVQVLINLYNKNVTNTQNIKPGVEELFSSNPELANQVYSKLLTNSGISAENLLSLLIKEKIVEKQCS
jgi:hypothetical protein